MADDESANLQATLEDQHPTLDDEYWNELNRRLRSGELSIVSVMLAFPPTIQGDMDALVCCSGMKKTSAANLIDGMQNVIDNNEPFGCRNLMSCAFAIAVVFFMLFFIKNSI